MKKSNKATDFRTLPLCLKFLLLMKLSFLLIFATCLQASARGYSQEKFNLHYKQVEVPKIFNTIQKQSKYRFFYNNGYINKLGKIDIDVTNAELENVLNIVLGNKFKYTINDQQMVIISPVSNDEQVSSVADTNEIKGKIVDENNKPLSGVTIKLKGSAKTVTTDESGSFTIFAPPGSELEISYVGYKEQSFSVRNQKLFTVQLQPNATGLNEVVVVGYGTQKKRDVTGSISTVKGDDFKNLPVSNPADALQGRAAGVEIIRDDGSPGSIPNINIRGTGTINNSSPLIVIDGVPAGGLNDVNSNDIASIEILKDASASAIYGSRAANGVVLITTKKGNFSEKAKTTVNLYTGSNSPVKFLKMLTAPELAQLKTEEYTNDGNPAPAIWSNPYYQVQRTDWQRALMGTGHVQNADVAIRGGNASSVYSFSGNYYNDQGMIPNSFFTRYNFRINSEHKVGSRFRLGENVLFSNSNIVGPDTKSTQAGLVWSAIRFNPAIPVRNPDGTWGSSQSDQSDLGDINNPVATADETDAYNKTNRLLANAFAELEVIKGLTLRANYSIDNANTESYNFQVPFPTQTRGPANSSLNQGYNKSNTFLEEYFLTYNKRFNSGHNLTFTGGYSAQKLTGNYFNASANNYADTSANQRVLSLGNNPGNNGNNSASEGLESYFGRLNYDYKGKYLLTFTMRSDGSSKFAPGHQWGYFPAFSTGWRISDEKFFAGLKDVINSLKITGGWGELGNQNIPDFQYLSIIGAGISNPGSTTGAYGYALGSPTAMQAGAYITGLANPNITWERAVMTNIAIDFSTFDNHLNGTVTYFNKNTSEMLIPYQLVETFGAQTNLPDDPGNVTLPNQNIGKMNNHGVEIELNYQNSVGKFRYSFGANVSFLRNKVTTLYGNSNYIASTPYGRENADISRTYQGQPIASFYGFKTNGLYQTQADIDNDPSIKNDPNKPNIKPGDVRFLDINGDGVIDDKDRVNLGNPNPHEIFGFHGSVSYSNFDLNFNFAGSAGFKLYDADRLAGLDATQIFNWYQEQMGRWHGAGTSNSIPELSVNNLNNNYRSSDLWVQNGSYLSLKSLSLGYTVTKKHVGTYQLPDIRIYVSSYNVFMITGYKGYTPELGYTSSGGAPANSQRGVDVAQYPSTRNLTIGATVNF